MWAGTKVEFVFPKMTSVRREFPPPAACDLRSALHSLPQEITRGSRIAVAVGSRGISNLLEMVRLVVDHLKSLGAVPFIVPAMGSHGGATPDGQLAILSKYGIMEEALGVPIRPSLDTKYLGRTAEGVPVHFSSAALESDGIIPINRIKPHTDFQGSIGSGLAKMLVIGLGKQRGAASCHAAAAQLGLERVIRSAASHILTVAPVLFGVAIVEDACHRTAHVECVSPRTLLACEERLLQEAARLMPRLPFDDIDLLIVDRMGKNISGSGIDPNVIGRSVHGYSTTLSPSSSPRIRRIFVRELTEESQGNAIGIGLADFTTTRLVEQIDFKATSTNALTSLAIQAAKIPMHFQSDRECIQNALVSVASEEPAEAKVVRIRDTLSLSLCEVSEAYAPMIAGRSDLSLVGTFRPMSFGSHGNLCPMDG